MPPELVARGRAIALDRPLLMGVVNATPDSFSDGGRYPTLQARLELAAELIDAGADIIDVGGQSAITGVPEIPVTEEIERVVPVIEKLAGELGALISVDTYRPAVAEAAIDAGAAIVNDISGLRDTLLADVCAASGAALVVTHNRGRPKVRLTDPALYEDVVADVEEFLRERLELLAARGVAERQTIVDPGPDFAKTPAQTIAVLRDLDRVRALGRPLLLALSRKDFIGALTNRPPRERSAGTLAAIATLARAGDILRVHDVAAAVDLLAVRGALDGSLAVPDDLELPVALRREPAPGA